MIHNDDVAADLEQQLATAGITGVNFDVAASTDDGQPIWRINVRLDHIKPGDDPDTEHLDKVQTFFRRHSETIRMERYARFLALHLTRGDAVK
ncbi:hypothetical protein FHX42_005265 [Saccharopolyspora lacisalsi]|uniref:Uncharacterized protein n=1 Tax=Halosaccharopolyspora lacisalsi TaxID=1000566 RepID=A0A839EAI9_9PSEU|nr:hypothetical protein [Halosaccharopolyspora lacisalsi]MBA8827858.1 hypothetical protein [Halosaccharopolyspora lacisalsi]